VTNGTNGTPPPRLVLLASLSRSPCISSCRCFNGPGHCQQVWASPASISAETSLPPPLTPSLADMMPGEIHAPAIFRDFLAEPPCHIKPLVPNPRSTTTALATTLSHRASVLPFKLHCICPLEDNCPNAQVLISPPNPDPCDWVPLPLTRYTPCHMAVDPESDI
jgi:hypothetical protein